MFNFLIILGISSIALGFYLNSKSHSLSSPIDISNNSDKFHEIINRIELIEEELKYYYTNDNKVDFIDVLDAVKVNEETFDEEKQELGEEMSEAFKIISLYVDGKYSLEQVCKILAMRKGEVLFLRNLYKKYQE